MNIKNAISDELLSQVAGGGRDDVTAVQNQIYNLFLSCCANGKSKDAFISEATIIVNTALGLSAANKVSLRTYINELAAQMP